MSPTVAQSQIEEAAPRVAPRREIDEGGPRFAWGFTIALAVSVVFWGLLAWFLL